MTLSCSVCYTPKREGDADYMAASVRLPKKGAPAQVTLYPWNPRDGGYPLCSIACAKTLLSSYHRRLK